MTDYNRTNHSCFCYCSAVLQGRRYKRANELPVKSAQMQDSIVSLLKFKY